MKKEIMTKVKTTYNPMTFTLSSEQVKKYQKWRKKKNGEVNVGSAYSFCFTPSGIGMIECVKCSDGTELDLTDFEKW